MQAGNMQAAPALPPQLDPSFAWDYLVIRCCLWLNDITNNRENLRDVLQNNLVPLNNGAIDRDQFYNQYVFHDLFNAVVKSALFHALADNALAAQNFLQNHQINNINEGDFARNFCVYNPNFVREAERVRHTGVANGPFGIGHVNFVGSISTAADNHYYGGGYNNYVNNNNLGVQQQQQCLVF